MVAIIHLLLSITLLIASSGGGGLTSIITVMCLFCATSSFNYCCVLIYIIYTGFDWLQNIDPVGLYIQNRMQGVDPEIALMTAGGSFGLGIFSTMVIFEPIAIYMAFQAYKEFKGCLTDHGGSLNGMGMGGGGSGLMGGGGAGGGGGARAQGTNSYNGNSTAMAGGDVRA